MLERITRSLNANSATVNVTTGRIMCGSDRPSEPKDVIPCAGSQPRSTANTRMSISPSQNPGTEKAPNAAEDMTVSSLRERVRAARAPSTIPPTEDTTRDGW